MNRLSRTGIFPVLFFFLAAAFTPARSLSAQGLVRSWLPWRTIETKHFVFHYPADLEDWTRATAARADAIDSSVARLTGYAPAAKTHVVVDDPYSMSNGSAWPFLDLPVINLWASPPDPRLDIGEFRDWGPTLLSHEFAHIAHLSRPSRNAMLRTLWRLAPVDLGPITIDAPRWVIEGYATYAEGRVTGSGRPHGSWRPAYLRQWALEGTLPRYDQLNGFGSFEGGEFAYLAGSAFLEWLAATHGDSSLADVWRRMTAKQRRSFDEAFSGVYGQSAAALYGRFTADLTGKALEVERSLKASARRDSGEIVQRLSWSTGDPAISPDGRRVAISLASPSLPARIVIWSTAAEPDTLRARRDSALRARDPEDVPARPIFPPAKRVLATLRATTGSPYESPRFLRDGRVLVSRFMRMGDGSLRPDLFIWDPQRRTVHRVTHGASLRDADPTPDGRAALAMKCEHGWCDVALVDLATGRDSVVLRGSPSRSFYRPRVSPDGGRFAVSMSEGGRWRVVVVQRATGELSDVAFSGNAYDAAWIDGDRIVATADGSGIPNIELANLNSATVAPLTAVTGAAVAADAVARDAAVWFLSLHSRGYDLRRVPVAGARDSLPANDPRLVPATASPPVALPAFGENAVSEPRPFGLEPRLFRWLPIPYADADGLAASLALSSGDVIGRSEVVARVAAGDRAAWHGAAIDATWRGFRPFVRLGLFDAMQSLTASRSQVAGGHPFDVHLRGLLAVVDGARAYESWSARYRLVASASRLSDDSSGDSSGAETSRALMIGDAGLGFLQRFGASGVSESLGANLTLGNAFDERFYRAVATGSATAFGFTPVPLSVSATYARTTHDAPPFERASLGGGPSGLVDRLLLTQRIGMPALPSGIAIGSSALTYLASINTQPLALYFWSGATSDDDSFRAWHRVIGLEGSQSVGAIPVAGVPSARIVYGLGESLDAPFRRQVRGYVSVSINP